MFFGQQLKTIRKKRGLSQKEFADVLAKNNIEEVTQKTISTWENGKRIPSVETILRISEAFDMPVEEMIKGTHEEKVIDAMNRKKAAVDLTTAASRDYELFIDGTKLTEKEIEFLIESYRTAKKSFV